MQRETGKQTQIDVKESQGNFKMCSVNVVGIPQQKREWEG